MDILGWGHYFTHPQVRKNKILFKNQVLEREREQRIQCVSGVFMEEQETGMIEMGPVKERLLKSL